MADAFFFLYSIVKRIGIRSRGGKQMALLEVKHLKKIIQTGLEAIRRKPS